MLRKLANGIAAALVAALVLPALMGAGVASADTARLEASAGPAFVGPAASIVPLTPTHSVAAGTSVVLIAQVLDADGLPVPSTLVYFTTNAPGAVFQTFPNVLTGDTGYAQATLTVPTTAGVYAAWAYASGVATPATFLLNVGGGTGPGTGVGTGIQILSGNGQVVPQAFPIALKPLTVIVKDEAGNPVPGVFVNWMVTSGVATLYQSVSMTDSTGQSGVSVAGSTFISPGTPYQQAMITASTAAGSVTFVLTVIANVGGSPVYPVVRILSPPEATPIVGKAGQVLQDAIQVLVETPTGERVPYVGLEVAANQDPAVGPVAACSSTNILTDIAGYAKCDLVFGRRTGTGTLSVNVGNVRVVPFDFEVTAGDPASMVVIQGDNQSGSPGQTLAQALVAEVRDSAGNPLMGVPVLWQFGAEGTGARLIGASQTTNSAGRVSATVVLRTTPGELIVRVRAAAVPSAVATFTLRAVLPIAGMVKISGDNQTAVISQAFAAPLVVEVRDAQALPLANVSVAFAVSSGSAILGGPTALTDAQGRASMYVQAGAVAGAITVTATADGQSVTFSLTARLPGPVLTASDFVNGASFRIGLVPGSVTAIVGPGLAPGIQGCMGSGTVVGPLPTKVADVEVMFGGTLAPIYSVCNVSGQEQVVVQAPWDMAPGFTVMVTVKVGGGSTVVDKVPVLAALPGIFETITADGRRHAVAVGPDGTLISPAKRAKKGEAVRFYATGLGVVLPLAATNQPGFPGQKVWLPVIAGVGGKGVRVISAELAVNMTGVYEIAIEIPADAPSGDEVALDLAVVTTEGMAPVFAATSKIAIQ